MTGKVFMLQRPTARHDIDDLYAYGIPVTLFTRGFYPDDVKSHYIKVIATCDENLSDFNSETDYIVPMGDSCVVAVVTMWLADYDKLPAKFLKYDKKLGGFYEIEIGLYDDDDD